MTIVKLCLICRLVAAQKTQTKRDQGRSTFRDKLRGQAGILSVGGRVRFHLSWLLTARVQPPDMATPRRQNPYPPTSALLPTSDIRASFVQSAQQFSIRDTDPPLGPLAASGGAWQLACKS